MTHASSLYRPSFRRAAAGRGRSSSACDWPCGALMAAMAGALAGGWRVPPALLDPLPCHLAPGRRARS